MLSINAKTEAARIERLKNVVVEEKCSCDGCRNRAVMEIGATPELTTGYALCDEHAQIFIDAFRRSPE